MTDEIKALLKAAKTEEEAKEILLAHKNELTKEEQEKISGGTKAFSDLPLDIDEVPKVLGHPFGNVVKLQR